MDPLDHAINAARKKAAASPRQKTVKLGDVLTGIIDRRVTPMQAGYAAIAEAWDQLLPAELAQHCRISDFSRGRLRVKVDSPSHKYELQLCSAELLGQLKKMCPRARIARIELLPG